MTIEHDELDKEWDSRSHTPDEYRREIRELRDRCAKYAQEQTALDAELAELWAQKVRGTPDFYRPWRSVHDDPPPFDVPILVAVSILGRDDFVFAGGISYRKPNGAYADAQGHPLVATTRPEFWLALDGLEGLRHHDKEVKP